jgi:hypothetical protein
MNLKFTQKNQTEPENPAENWIQKADFEQNGDNYIVKHSDFNPIQKNWSKYETKGQICASWENVLLKLKAENSLDYQFVNLKTMRFCEEEDAATFLLAYENFDFYKYETLQLLTKLASFLIGKICKENIQFHFQLVDWENSRKENQLLLSNEQADMQLLAFYDKITKSLSLHLQNENQPFHLHIQARISHFLGQTKKQVLINLLPLADKIEELQVELVNFAEKNTAFQFFKS